jgi:hypothetical protein
MTWEGKEGNTLKETYKEALLWKSKIDGDTLLLDDLHKRGNIKGG